MPLAGNLRQVPLSKVLQMVSSGQRSGCLSLSRGKLRAAVYFSGGQWLLAQRLGMSVPLAQHLVQSGVVDSSRIEAALGVSLAQTGSLSDMYVVRTLIGARLLTQQQLREFAVDDAVSLLTVVLGWPDGEFMFEDGVEAPKGSVALPLPLGPLLTQAMQLAKVSSPVRNVAPLAPETVLDFSEVDPESGAIIQLTREQWKILTLVDGHTPLWDISRQLQAPEGVILRLAAELLADGAVVVVGRVAPSHAQR